MKVENIIRERSYIEKNTYLQAALKEWDLITLENL